MGSNPIPPILNTNIVEWTKFDKARNITIPKFLSSKLAQDIGIHIGDGSMNIYNRSNRKSEIYYISCVGDIKEDRIFLKEIVAPLKKELFNVNVIMNDNDGAGTHVLRIYSKALLTFYNKVFNLPLGEKKEIKIPDKITNDKKFAKACLKGLFDTDGSLTFKKRYKEIHYYPTIHLKSKSKKLIKQVDNVLEVLDISHSITLNNKYWDKRTKKYYTGNNIYIYGNKNLSKYMDKIGFDNPKQLTRYYIWKKYGFCPPKTNINQRFKILNEELDPLNLYS